MDDPVPPTWVRSAEGRLEPFDAGRLCRALYAAAEASGRPDPFLARELAEGVLHFLAVECEGEVPTPSRIAEVAAKTVRELGHPALAAAFEARRPSTPPDAEYSRDILAAAETGLLHLDDIRRPAAILSPHGQHVHRNVSAGEPQGPLFSEQATSPRPDLRVRAQNAPPCIDWHVGSPDDDAPVGEANAFTFDRPGRTVQLGYGVDLGHPASLSAAGLDLAALAQRPGLMGDVGQYLLQAGRLAGIALAAAAQKRGRLRRGRELAEGFVLERARVCISARNLDQAARLFTGAGLAEGAAALDLAKRLLRRLREALRAEGRATHLEAHLEADVELGPTACLDATLHAASVLHALTDGGTATVHAEEPRRREVLRDAYLRTNIHRLVFR
jgi:hypothetical protein